MVAIVHDERVGHRGRRDWWWPGTALVVAAAGVGVATTGGPTAVVGVTVAVAALAASRFLAADEALLHLLTLSVFAEGVGVGPARVGRILALTALVTLVLRAPRALPRLRRLSGPVLTATTAFLAWVWASGLWSVDTRGWLASVGGFGLAVAYFLAVAVFATGSARVRRMLRTYVAAATAVGAVAVVQAAAGVRAVGLQGDPNIFALYQVAAVPAAWALASRASTPARRILIGGSVVVLAASVVASQSRGGLFALLVVAVAMLARPRRRRDGLPARTVSIAAGVLALAAVTATALATSNRFDPQRIANDRASGRLDIWYVAWQLFLRHPVVGVGSGNFENRSIDLLQREPGVQLVKSHLLNLAGVQVHNDYLQALVEFGVVGALLYVVLLVTVWRSLARVGHRTWRAVSPDVLPQMLLGFVAASVFLSVLNNKLAWILAGLAAAAPRPPPLDGRRHVAGPPIVTTGGDVMQQPDQPWSLTLRRRWRSMVVGGVLAVAVAGAAAGYLTARLSPTYRSSVDFVVTNTGSATENETTVRTLQALVTSQVVAEDLRSRTGVGLSASAVSQRISVERPPGSGVFSVTVSDASLARSRMLAAAIVPVFQARVQALRGASQGGDTPSSYIVQPWGDGTVTTERVPPPVTRNTAIGVVLGLLLAAVWAAYRLQRRPAVLGAVGAYDAFGSPVLATLPPLDKAGMSATDAVDLVLGNALTVGWPRPTRCPMLVSLDKGGDYLRLVRALAGRFASMGADVVLIDADVTGKALTRAFGRTGEPGLLETLDAQRVDDVLVDLVDADEEDPDAGRVAFLPAGTADGRAGDALHGMPDVLAELTERFSVAIVDAPAVPGPLPVAGLLRFADAILVAAVHGVTPRRDAVQTADALRALTGAPVAVVLLGSDRLAAHLSVPTGPASQAPTTSPATPRSVSPAASPAAALSGRPRRRPAAPAGKATSNGYGGEAPVDAPDPGDGRLEPTGWPG